MNLEKPILDDYNDVDQLKNYLRNGSYHQTILDEYLVTACAFYSLEIITLLVNSGADINQDNKIFVTSINRSNEDIIRFLVKSGMSLKIPSDIFVENHYTLGCLFRLRVEFFEYLLDSGLELEYLLLSYAVELDLIDHFKIIFRRLSDIPIEKIWNFSIRHNSYEIMNYLLDLEIPLDFSSRHLLFAILTTGQSKLLKKILNRIDDPKLFLVKGSLTSACFSQDYETIKIVLEMIGYETEADPQYIFYKTPFELLKGDYELTKLLLSYDAVPNEKCLTNAGHNPKTFYLIYHSRQWSDRELIYVLTSFSSQNFHPEILIFLHGLLIDQIESAHLKTLVKNCFSYNMFDFLKYLVEYYGLDQLENLIEDGNKAIFKNRLEMANRIKN